MIFQNCLEITIPIAKERKHNIRFNPIFIKPYDTLPDWIKFMLSRVNVE